jgi:3-hydroxy-9,10-secoandrosta-1,3,5(10)-triene-9,17-dione monooxygenase reductase component
MSIEKLQFRNALGAFATGVTIVTTRDEGGRDVGLTANSFNSVSLDPPLVLWSLAKTSLSLAAFTKCAHFAVHILAADQVALSDQFAKRGREKFEGLQLERGDSEIPLLTGCTARFRCRTAYQYEGGDHIIFVGEVISFDHSARPPLVFHGGSYAVATRRNTNAPDDKADLAHLVQSAYFHLLTPVRAERERLGISLHEHYVLSVLRAHDDSTIEEIDSIIGYTGIHVTDAIAEGLVARGLAELEPGVEVRRLCLTAEGRHAVASLVGAAKAIEAEVMLHFSAEERRLLTDLLLRVVRITGDAGGAQVSQHMALLNQLLQTGRAPATQDD